VKKTGKKILKFMNKCREMMGKPKIRVKVITKQEKSADTSSSDMRSRGGAGRN
jgi:hypothetical protein